MIRSLARRAALFVALLCFASPALSQTDDYVPGKPHYTTLQGQQPSAKTKRPSAQEGELLVRVSSSTQQGFGALAADSSSIAIKKILANKASSVRSVLKLPDVHVKNLQGFSASQAPSSREWLSIALRQDSDGAEACQRLQDSGIIDACQRNLRHYVNVLPNDPLVTGDGSSLGACAFDQEVKNLWGHEMIRAFEAWNAPGCPEGGCQGQGVVVGVVDSGIDYTHPDIVNSLYVNPDEDHNHNGVFDPYPAAQGGDLDGVDSGGNSLIDDVVGANFVDATLPPYDELGHGTHCAGTISATAGNGVGIAGIAPKAKILTAKGISKDGYGTSEWLAQGLRYIVDTVDRNKDGKVDRPTVINNSWGNDSDQQDLILEDATRYAIAKGAVVVFAAGNSNVDASRQSPNSLPDAVMVAAVSPQGTKASFSNFGDRVAVSAPGGGGYSFSCSDPARTIPSYDYNILSLLAADSVFSKQLSSFVVGDKYIRLAGTSMAAPHVVGVVALLLSQRPYLTPTQVKNMLLAGTVPSRDWKYGSYTGTGIVDAVKILSLPDTINLKASFDRSEHEIVSGQADYSVAGETAAEKTEVFVTKLRDYKVVDKQLLSSIAGRKKGTFAVIDPRKFSVQDETWIEMVTYSGDYSATTRRRVFFDPTLRVGFPKKVSNTLSLGGGWYLRGQAAPIITDLSGNGEKRLVLGNPDGLWGGGFRIADRHGSILRDIQPTYLGSVGSLYAANLTGKGQQQILGIGAVDRVYTPDGDLLVERSLWAWSYTPTYTEYKGTDREATIGIVGSSQVPVVAQGGELVRWYPSFENAKTVTRSSLVHLLDGTLKDLPGWEGGKMLPEGEYLPSQPLIGDLNGDGQNEVIVGPSTQGNVRSFGLDGSLISEFKVEVNDKPLGAPVLGDLDQDGTNELIYWTGDTVNAVHSDGSALPGWPVKIASRYGNDWKVSIQNAALADINGDARPEVVGSASQLYSLFAIQHDGTLLPGWSPEVSDYFGVNGSPVVGQVDGSGKQNVVFRGSSSQAVKIVDSNGAIISDLTKRFDGTFITMPVIADVDSDGGNEIVAVNEEGLLFIWDTKGSSCDVSEWPTLGGDVGQSYVYSTPRQSPYVFGCGATMEVKIVDADETPVEGVVVDGGALGKRTSGSDGIVRFGGLPLGLSYKFSFSHAAYQISALAGTVRGDEARIVRGVAAPMSVAGRVVDSAAAAVGGVLIDGGVCGKAVSGSDGRFVLPNVRYGATCVLNASREGMSFSSSLTIRALSPDTSVTIVGARRRYTLVGRVLFNRRPVARATILSSTGGLMSTSRGGYFKLKDIEYGTQLRLTISAKGYTTRRIRVVVNAGRRIAIALHKRR